MPENSRETIHLSLLDRVSLKCDYEGVKASLLWPNFIIKAADAMLENSKTYNPIWFKNMGIRKRPHPHHQPMLPNEIFHPNTHFALRSS